MYFVDREKIEKTLVYLENLVALFLQQEKWSSPLEKAALERLGHMLLESTFDVGNAVIDGFIMRDPGSYEDIIEILTDEKVISEETGKALKELIPYRKVLVQMYTEINHAEMQAKFSAHLDEFSRFAKNVRAYLLNELGPVSAFKN